MNNIKNTETAFPSKNTYLFLQGEAGRLEILISPNDSPRIIDHSDSITIICHPHPMHGGTMDNKVVYTIHKALYGFGSHTIRFNYRGVGRSDGQFDESIGEYKDLLTVINWVKSQKPASKIILAGFSFGAYISLKASKDIDCLQLISVAPAVHHQNYNQHMPINCPWLLLQGDADEIVPPQQVFDWINTLEKKPTLIKFPEVGHFFHGNLIELREAIVYYLEQQQY